MSKQSNWIREIAPFSLKASSQTGMSVQLMLAQAAQETGWGQKILPGTNNIFNINADPNWKGETKTFEVTEYVNGKVVTVSAKFRGYNTVEDAFVDRVNFLKNNPRYAKSGIFDDGVLGNPDAEALALQHAGYATDPNYASNLMNVAHGSMMTSALDGLTAGGSDSLATTKSDLIGSSTAANDYRCLVQMRALMPFHIDNLVEVL